MGSSRFHLGPAAYLDGARGHVRDFTSYLRMDPSVFCDRSPTPYNISGIQQPRGLQRLALLRSEPTTYVYAYFSSRDQVK